MLPKKHRLSKREDFAMLYSKGSYASIHEGMTIKFLPTQNLETRIGFPLGKSFSKKAVVRNRARRILRAASFQFLNNLKPGWDIIVLIKPNYQDLEFKKVTTDLKKVFAKANLLT